MHIFFSWQSDISGSSKLIRECLEEAAKRIQLVNDIESPDRGEDLAGSDKLSSDDRPFIQIDSDTKGVLGSPEIASTIFKKITECDLFVADLTFVGKREENGRKISNPNVLIELGYAMATSPDAEKIVLIMDTTYGKKSQLPFDLRNRRFPIELSDTPDSREKAICLLTEIFKMFLEKKSSIASQTSNEKMSEEFLRTNFENVKSLWSEKEETLFWIGIAPDTIPSSSLDLDNEDLERAINFPDGRLHGWNLDQLDSDFHVEGDFVGRGKDIDSQLKFFDNGCMQLTLNINEWGMWSSDENTLHPIGITELPTAFLNLYKNIVAKLKLKGPFKIGIAYLNVSKLYLRPGHPRSSAFGFKKTSFNRPNISLRFWQIKSDFSPDLVAYSIAKYIYKTCGFKSDSIPYFDEKEGKFIYERGAH